MAQKWFENHLSPSYKSWVVSKVPRTASWSDLILYSFIINFGGTLHQFVHDNMWVRAFHLYSAKANFTELNTKSRLAYAYGRFNPQYCYSKHVFTSPPWKKIWCGIKGVKIFFIINWRRNDLRIIYHLHTKAGLSQKCHELHPDPTWYYTPLSSILEERYISLFMIICG